MYETQTWDKCTMLCVTECGPKDPSWLEDHQGDKPHTRSPMGSPAPCPSAIRRLFKSKYNEATMATVLVFWRVIIAFGFRPVHPEFRGRRHHPACQCDRKPAVVQSAIFKAAVNTNP